MICLPLKGPAGSHLSSIQHWMSHCPLVFWCQKSKPSSQIRFYLLHWYRNWKLAISHDWQLFTIRPVFWVVGGDHGRWQGHQGGWVGPRGGWQDSWGDDQGKKNRKKKLSSMLWIGEKNGQRVWSGHVYCRGGQQGGCQAGGGGQGRPVDSGQPCQSGLVRQVHSANVAW